MLHSILAEISDFEIQEPTLKIPQEQMLRWIATAHTRSENLIQGSEIDSTEQKQLMERLLKRYGVSPARISQRGVEALDIQNTDWSQNEIYPLIENSDAQTSEAISRASGSDIGVRTNFFLKRSTEVLKKFYPENATAPRHIVHVSCTGYASPSAPQRLVDTNKWNGETAVTHAYHMGCYAAMPAVRMGEGFIAALSAKSAALQSKKNAEQFVDIVHSEMCSLHMNPSNHTPEQLVVQSLFADGFIKYSMRSPGQFKNGFSVLNIEEQIIPDTAEHMTWHPASWGMSMTLSREVPEKIAAQIRPFLERLLNPTGLNLIDVLKNATFAVHPGGPKIIDSVQALLELREDQVAHSKKVLYERGNMSSATLPHVWAEIMNASPHSGQVVISLAFGPGLTIFGSAFKII